MDRLISIYQAVLAESPPKASDPANAVSASGYLASLAGMLKERENADARAIQAETSAAHHADLLQQSLQGSSTMASENDRLRGEISSAKEGLAASAARQIELGELATGLQREAQRLRNALADALAQSAARLRNNAIESAAASAENQRLRAELDSANAGVATLHEIERSRAWRLIGLYRRARRWLS